MKSKVQNYIYGLVRAMGTYVTGQKLKCSTDMEKFELQKKIFVFKRQTILTRIENKNVVFLLKMKMTSNFDSSLTSLHGWLFSEEPQNVQAKFCLRKCAQKGESQ